MLIIPRSTEIRNRREALKLSQKQLSLKAGLAGNSIYRIEAGESKKINHLRAREIARVLGCNVEDICSVPERRA